MKLAILVFVIACRASSDPAPAPPAEPTLPAHEVEAELDRMLAADKADDATLDKFDLELAALDDKIEATTDATMIQALERQRQELIANFEIAARAFGPVADPRPADPIAAPRTAAEQARADQRTQLHDLEQLDTDLDALAKNTASAIAAVTDAKTAPDLATAEAHLRALQQDKRGLEARIVKIKLAVARRHAR